jgi:hypothetical protein
VTGQWFSPRTPVSSTNKTDLHDITEILLKVVLNTMIPIPNPPGPFKPLTTKTDGQIRSTNNV